MHRQIKPREKRTGVFDIRAREIEMHAEALICRLSKLMRKKAKTVASLIWITRFRPDHSISGYLNGNYSHQARVQNL